VAVGAVRVEVAPGTLVEGSGSERVDELNALGRLCVENPRRDEMTDLIDGAIGVGTWVGDG
jgi:hypothetical protein